MSIPVQFVVGQLPNGYCFPGPQQFVLDILGPSGIVTATIPGSGVPILVQAAAPGPQFQGNTLWGKLVGGYLEGTYWYNGGWFRQHPVPASSQSRLIWMGSEAALWAYDGGDGTNPGTTPPTATTGAMWQRDTTFGADDGSSIFKFPVGIGVNPTAYDGNPALTIGVGGTGGEQRHKLVAGEIPSAIGFAAPVTGAWVREAGSGTTNLQSAAGNNDGLVLPTTGSDKSHENMPSYIGVIFAKRTARYLIQG